MLELTSNGRPVALAPGTSVQLELNSALFDEDVVRGNFSYSFNVPAPPNGPLYGFPERPDYDRPASAELPGELSLDGLPLLVGTQQVRSANARQYSIALGGGLSSLAAALTGRAIHTFDYGGYRTMPPAQPYGGAGAGGLLQVPGWVSHANAVVRNAADYDYVFAPVRCDNFFEPAPAAPAPAAGAPAAAPLPPAVLNPWVNQPASGPVNGVPPGGSFTWMGFTGYNFWYPPRINFFEPVGTPAPAGVLLPSYGQFACPFPRLRYILRSIFLESGLYVDEDRFLPGELGELVVFSPANTISNSPDAAGVVQSGFYLADSLPDITVAELLNALRKSLGLVIDFNPETKTVYSRLLRDVVAEPATGDLTAQLAGSPELSFGEARPLKLVYDTDPDDLATKDLAARAPDPRTLAPAVATLADLPGTGVFTLATETRLVRDQGAYYQSQIAGAAGPGAVALTWRYLAPQLTGLEVGGADGEEIGQGLAYTAMDRVPFSLNPAVSWQLDPAATAWAEVPRVSRPGYQIGLAAPQAAPRPKALRLLFWRGLQPASDGTLYPLVTPLATNQAGAAVGGLSLRIGGPAGTYQQLLRGWLDVKRRNVVLKANLRLTSLDLARLDLSRKVRLDDVEYLVRKLSVSVPLARPAVAELVRV